MVDQLRDTLRTQLQEEQSQFLQTVLGELNSRGVFDAAERNRIIQQRISEALRLGIISGTGASFGTGGTSTGGTGASSPRPTL
jgi:hypothetical protein